MTRKLQTSGRKLSRQKLEEMIAEATADAHDEGEAVMGFFTMLQQELEARFKTKVLGIEVVVEGVDLTDDNQIVAVCSRGRFKQSIPILGLPLPKPPPEGTEWIEAYRQWARGR